VNRRNFVRNATLGVAASSLLPSLLVSQQVWAQSESRLIYISPMKSNGDLSRCQAEVWYVGDASDFVVVTGDKAWRARAVANGLTKAQVWVGDVGVWKKSDGRYKELPAQTMNASLENDSGAHARVLEIFSRKYASAWSTWGPRFENSLADGSRVMLRYTPV